MYPDTDLPPKRIHEDRLIRIRATLPSKFWDSESWYRKLGIPGDVIRPLSVSTHAPLFKYLIEKLKIDPILASVVLIQYPKRIKKALPKSNPPDENTIKELLIIHKEGKIAREGILEMMLMKAKNGKFEIPPACSEKELTGLIRESMKKLNETEIRNPEKKEQIIMGLIMSAVRGRVEGKKVAARVRKEGL